MIFCKDCKYYKKEFFCDVCKNKANIYFEILPEKKIPHRAFIVEVNINNDCKYFEPKLLLRIKHKIVDFIQPISMDEYLNSKHNPLKHN